MTSVRVGTLVAGTLCTWLLATRAEAQGYRLRLDSRAQRVSYRGVTQDSVLAGQTVSGPTGGPRTPDGFAVTCPEAGTYCYYFRPGPDLRSGPMVSTADLTLWGFGVRGLTVRMNGRLGVDLGRSDVWPGTEPAVQLLEAYAEYAHREFTVRGGRQLLANRLGVVGFDGGRATVRTGWHELEAEIYAGWGLARATALPVTSPVLNPLDDFQPRRRQILAGAALRHTGRAMDVRADYQREIDGDTHNFVSERAAVALDLRPLDHWNLTGGVDYDLTNTWFGNADAVLRYIDRRITVAGGVRQYRPHFDLWTIWGAFSPVPYHAVNAGIWFRPARGLELRGRWESYAFTETETETPLVQVDDDGWRVGAGVTYNPAPGWTLDLAYRRDDGPGASSHGFDGSVSFVPSRALALTAYGSSLDRPLEFRFEDASVDAFGLEAEWSPTPRLRLSLGAARYAEGRDRPDAAAFDWNQVRLQAGVTLLLQSNADLAPLPPALRTSRPGTR